MEQFNFFLFQLGQCPSPTEMGLLHEIRHITEKGKKYQDFFSFSFHSWFLAKVLKMLLHILNDSSIDLLVRYLDIRCSPFPLLLIDIKKQIKVK